MIRLLVDENFNRRIVSGLLRRDPSLDLVDVRKIGLAAAPDPAILQWAAVHDRVLLTHDVNTIPAFAHARIAAGLAMPGVFLARKSMPLWQAIDDILLALHCLTPDECKDIVKYFPL